MKIQDQTGSGAFRHSTRLNPSKIRPTCGGLIASITHIFINCPPYVFFINYMKTFDFSKKENIK